MTQLFIGYKPNVGPVVKVLKYDTDDPLTLANDAYDRYYFNSENQKLAMVRDQRVQWFNYWNDSPSVNGTVRNYDGDNNTAKYTANFTKLNSSSAGGYARFYARRQNLFPDIPYPPMAESRTPDSAGWITSGSRQLQWVFDGTGADPREVGVYCSYQYANAWVKPQYLKTNIDWRYRFYPNVSYMGTDEWVMVSAVGVDGRDGNSPNEVWISEFIPDASVVHAYWDLPTDGSPMSTYTNQPNLEMFRANQQGVIMSRPGYSVDSSAGTRHRILDSTIDLASIVMIRTQTNIQPGQSVDVLSHLSMPMSTYSVVDMMIKETGEEQYVPPHILSGYAKDRNMWVQHKVNPYSVSLWNRGTHAVDVTFIVFNIDPEPQTTGGSEIIRRVNVGGKEEIQIKKPNSSDSNPKVSDLLLDTRFPTMQIIQEGFIASHEFSDDPENQVLLGRVAKQVNFNNNGFTPFVKFSLVFEDRIHPPIMSRLYQFSTTTGASGGSKFSSLARVRNNNVKFWINPDSWSSIRLYENNVRVEWFGGNPIGIRYYIFGVSQ